MDVEKENIVPLNSSLVRQLFYALSVVLVLWYFKFHWKRRRLHELAAKLPGPRWFPFVGSIQIFLGSPRDITQVGADLHKEYPTPFALWLGPTELIVFLDKPEEIQTVLTSSKALTKSVVYRFMKAWLGDGMITAPADIWRRHKKIISPTFHQKVLDTFVVTFTEKNDILLEKLKEKVNKDYFDVFDYVSPCTLDIVCETMMGVDLNVQREYVPFVDQLDYTMIIVSDRMFKPWLHLDFINKMTGYEKQFKRVANYVNTFSDGIIKNKKRLLKDVEENPCFETESKINKRKGFLDLLLDMSEAESNLTDEEIRDEVNTMTSAANDTTANVAGFVFMILGIFPEIQEKMYQEIIDVLGETDRTITPEDLVSLTYMERVIKETMRYFPPVPLIGRYLSGEIQLGKHLLPANCTVVLFVNHIHKNEKLWKDPHKFDPDRFLPEECAKRHSYSYLPFGGGQRICLGQKYAMMSLKVMLAAVLRHYRIHCDYKLEDVKLRYALVWKPIGGHRVKITHRNPKTV